MRWKYDVLNDVRTVEIAFSNHFHLERHVDDAVAAVVSYVKALVQSFPVERAKFKLIGSTWHSLNKTVISGSIENVRKPNAQ